MKNLLITSLLVFGVSTAFAQHGKSETEEAIRKKYEQDNAGYKQKGMDWMANAMNGKTDPQYEFPLFMNMHVTDYKNGEKKSENDMKFYVNSTNNTFAMRMGDDGKKKKKEEVLMIYDYKNNSMIMLNETEKTGMAMNINAFMSADAQAKRGQGAAGSKSGSTSCKKTGKSRTIQGYPCEEYVCVDEDRNTRSEIWITTKVHLDLSQSGSRSPWASYFGATSGLGGMMIEGNFYKNSQQEAKMEVTEINEHADMNVKMSDYTIGMGGMR